LVHNDHATPTAWAGVWFGTVPPSFSELPRDLEVTANGRIALECVAAGIPTPVITWKINNTDFHGLSSRPPTTSCVCPLLLVNVL